MECVSNALCIDLGFQLFGLERRGIQIMGNDRLAKLSRNRVNRAFDWEQHSKVFKEALLFFFLTRWNRGRLERFTAYIMAHRFGYGFEAILEANPCPNR